MRDNRVFGIAAALVGLLCIYWSYVPIRRMESKVGSWSNALEVLASDPVHWALVVLIRLVLAALLVWLAVRQHRSRRWIGYAALVFAVPLMWIADVVLWAFLDI